MTGKREHVEVRRLAVPCALEVKEEEEQEEERNEASRRRTPGRVQVVP